MSRKRKITMVLVGALIVSAIWIGAAVKVFTDYANSIERHEFIMPASKREGAIPVLEFREVSLLTPDHIDEEVFYDSMEYLAQAVEAEAGNQGYWGKRKVARVMINRLLSDLFPSRNYYEVINQPHQFEVVSNGHINCIPTEETIKAVQDEMASCSDSRILFFTAGGYNSSGTPLYKYGDHYFSGK